MKKHTKRYWIKLLKPYWKKYTEIENEFFNKVGKLEEKMRRETGEPNIEFSYSKYGIGMELYFGIGFQRDGKRRPPNLIHGDELF